MIERIDHWVVVMFENRSFDCLLGYLPHIETSDGVRDREIVLSYPEGKVPITPTAGCYDPVPDPGEGYGNVNVQLWGQYIPESNLGKSAFPLFPHHMQPPYNLPPDGGVPTMDGFALDYFGNFLWEKGRTASEVEMQSIGAIFTPETAPVINKLASEYAVFTHWFCEVPACTFPNRSFFHTGTSLGKIDNEIGVTYAFNQDQPSLFELLTDRGIEWRLYYEPHQVVPECAINLGGARHFTMWRTHTAPRGRFFKDAAEGALPAYSWVEPTLFFGNHDDYHPPSDICRGEKLLASVYHAARGSPQWKSTALIVLFDEHGGCFDHVPPPRASIPDGSRGEQGFEFDRLGLRIPALVISPYTEKGTVISDDFHSCSVLRTLRERFDLGPALTRRDDSALFLSPAFNLSIPRNDMPIVKPRLHVRPDQSPNPGDSPNLGLLMREETRVVSHQISRLGKAALRNAARRFGDDPATIPNTVREARRWLRLRFGAHHHLGDGRS